MIVLTALCSPGTVSAGNATGPASCPPVERVAFERDGAVWSLDAEAKPRRVASGGCPALSPDGTHIPVWSPDGEYVYFTGYRDTQARETYPFRVLRVHRTGRDLREITPGERPSVARTTPASCQ